MGYGCIRLRDYDAMPGTDAAYGAVPSASALLCDAPHSHSSATLTAVSAYGLATRCPVLATRCPVLT
eukprot:914986-Rhodomonas_salina.4